MSDKEFAPCCGREIHDWDEADQGRCEECFCMDIQELRKAMKDALELLKGLESCRPDKAPFHISGAMSILADKVAP